MSTTDFWFSNYNLLDKLAGIHIQKMKDKYENIPNNNSNEPKTSIKKEVISYYVEDCEVD